MINTAKIYMNSLFLSPHNDDAALFGAFTLWREKPLVVTVTDSYIQSNRGENITADQRWFEDVEAMKILECPIIRLGIRDDIIYPEIVKQVLERFQGFDTIYAPAVQGGNKDHDLVGKIALEIFGEKVIQYSTYAKGEWFTQEGTVTINPSDDEKDAKNKALDCYKSQIELPATRGHFDAVRKENKEWYI